VATLERPPGGPGAPAQPRSRTAKATFIRLVVGPVILAGVFAVSWIHVATGNPLGTDVMLGVFCALAGAELALLLSRGSGRRGPVWVPALACAALGAIGLFAPEDLGLRTAWRSGLVAGSLVLLMAIHWRDVAADAVERIARAFLPVVYVGLLFSWVRDLADGPEGGRRLIWVVLMSKASDMGGWLVGKPLGKHKLVPSVSPGKSWEGLAGGLGGSLAVALFLAGPLGVTEASWSALERGAFGIAVGLASVAAGITQSGWKRRVGAKDSSTLLPEMGGVLDMIDSLLFAAPVAVFWFWLSA
jgi:phosphatidate cytidylyltransferase